MDSALPQISDIPRQEEQASPLDTRAWMIWIAGICVPAITTLNPWYQAILIGIILLLWPGDASDNPQGFLRLGLLVRIAVISLLFGSVFNMLAIHYGETVLVKLPEALPIIGGVLTLEALIYGFLNALRLVSILLAFAVFSRSINYADLLRLAPSALFELGLMMSIGFTLIPLTLRAFNEIRDAQQLRGHRPRGIRDVLPLFAPLVVNGMEHALALAESMEARGYGGVKSSRRVAVGQVLALIGVVGLMALLLIQTFSPLSPLLLATGLFGVLALLVLALQQLSSASGRTRLQRGHWRWQETVVALGALGAATCALLIDHSLTVYDPYQLSTLGWPPFNPWIGLTLLLLALPGLLVPVTRKPTT